MRVRLSLSNSVAWALGAYLRICLISSTSLLLLGILEALSFKISAFFSMLNMEISDWFKVPTTWLLLLLSYFSILCSWMIFESDVDATSSSRAGQSINLIIVLSSRVRVKHILR
jgi:hypothetical protein